MFPLSSSSSERCYDRCETCWSSRCLVPTSISSATCERVRWSAFLAAHDNRVSVTGSSMWLDASTFDGVDAKVGLPTVARPRVQASGGWWTRTAPVGTELPVGWAGWRHCAPPPENDPGQLVIGTAPRFRLRTALPQ